MKNILVGAGAVAITTLSFIQSASAVVFSFSFEDNGGGTIANGVVTGEVEFDDVIVTSTYTGSASPIRLEIFSATEPLGSLINDADAFQLNENIASLDPDGYFEFSNGDIINANFIIDFGENGQIESLQFSNDAAILYDYDEGSGITNGDIRNSFIDPNSFYTENFQKDSTTSVPFEFSPSLGIIVIGLIFGINRYIKYRKA